jgi:hypothetical protein
LWDVWFLAFYNGVPKYASCAAIFKNLDADKTAWASKKNSTESFD